jgi:cytochrome c oxidase assembly protein subunit 15
MRSFTRYAWFVLAYHLAVIAWGGLVRATGSGAGCGKHWPTCQGEVVPRSPAADTAVEFTHRASSGLAFVLVLALATWAWRRFGAGHPARRAAMASLFFLLTEALLGAGLVLLGFVAKDASAGRGWAMALHLGNTFLLLGSLALTATWSDRAGGIRTGGRGPLPVLVAIAAVATLLTAVSGAIAALGETLFPATSFARGLQQDFERGAHVLLRLRVLHPPLAILASLSAVSAAVMAMRVRPLPRVRRAALALLALVAVQLLAGMVNLALLAPIWLQMAHLVLADLLWIDVVLLGANVLEPGGQEVRAPAAGAADPRAGMTVSLPRRAG